MEENTQLELLLQRFKIHEQNHLELNKRLEHIEEIIGQTLTNHLIHIKEDILRLKITQKWLVAVAGTIGGIISGIITVLIINFIT